MDTQKFLEEHQDVFYPPSEFDGYEILNEEKENLRNIYLLLSSNEIDMQNVCFSDKYEFVDSLMKIGIVTNDLEQEYNVTDIVDEINRIVGMYTTQMETTNVKNQAR